MPGDQPPKLEFKPLHADALESLIPMEDEYAWGESLIEYRRVRVPRLLTYGVLALLGLALVVAAVWGLAQSTWTYGASPVDADTTARLTELHDALAAAGAPAAVLQHVARAAEPGINSGDAIEALVSADKYLSTNNDPAIISARKNLRIILEELESKRKPSPGTPRITTPLPLLTP